MGWTDRSLNSGRGSRFSHLQTRWRPALCLTEPLRKWVQDSSPGGKVARSRPYYSPPSRMEVENDWNYTHSPPPHPPHVPFMARKGRIYLLISIIKIIL
jgi:hypothetical protein